MEPTYTPTEADDFDAFDALEEAWERYRDYLAEGPEGWDCQCPSCPHWLAGRMRPSCWRRQWSRLEAEGEYERMEALEDAPERLAEGCACPDCPTWPCCGGFTRCDGQIPEAP